MPSQKGKIVVFIILLLLGIALLTYGAFFHSAKISPQPFGGELRMVEPQADDSTMLVKSEPALIKEVSIGGIKRDESGKIIQTYTGQAPQACPT
ncbi:MAG: hypothetical protein A2173_10850 [Planctomycetes bacterium RBG_13_44_8b]|nr:MAG: hypothetical protein A2173_10850 [Planctomycetes bacterium RBG_13_44_8b]